jgi:hypothetical protein
MDICRPTSNRKVTDVSHVISAVGSRNISKAEKFIQDFCPEGADAQQRGLSDLKPKAVGSYKELVEHSVSSGKKGSMEQTDIMVGRGYRLYWNASYFAL